jgi:hypothetical protein
LNLRLALKIEHLGPPRAGSESERKLNVQTQLSEKLQVAV